MAAFFKARIGEHVYTLEKLTLGDARILKRDFGLEDMDEFSPTDPDTLVGLLYLCLKAERPLADRTALIAEVEALDIDAFSDETEADEDPTPAAQAADEDASPAQGSGG